MRHPLGITGVSTPVSCFTALSMSSSTSGNPNRLCIVQLEALLPLRERICSLNPLRRSPFVLMLTFINASCFLRNWSSLSMDASFAFMLWVCCCCWISREWSFCCIGTWNTCSVEDSVLLLRLYWAFVGALNLKICRLLAWCAGDGVRSFGKDADWKLSLLRLNPHSLPFWKESPSEWLELVT